MALGLGGVGAGVGPVAGQGAVEAFDLAVGLGTVGAGALGLDTQLLAGGFLDLGAESLSDRTRSTLTPRALNHDTAR